MDKRYIVLKQEIDSGKVKNTYLLLGKNEYLKDEFIKNIESKFIVPEFLATNKISVNLSNLGELEEIDVFAWLRSLPFSIHHGVAGKKLLVVRMEKISSLTAKIKHQLQEWINMPVDSGILVILYKETKLPVNVGLKMTNAESCTCWDFWKNEARARIKTYISSMGMRIEEGAIDFLMEVLGTDMYSITMEINKLINYVLPDRFIKEEALLLTSGVDGVCSVVELAEAVGNKEFVKAMRLLDLLLKMGEPWPKILWHINNQFKNIFNLKCGKALDLSDKKLEGYRYRAKKWTETELLSMFSLIYEVDYNIKSGKGKPEFILGKMLCKSISEISCPI